MTDNSFIPVAVPLIGEAELNNLSEAVREGWISSFGRFVTGFEEEFSRYCGARHGVAVTSGTTAIHLALAAAGVGPGDEVILPPVTHIACANMVSLCGAKPVFADCEKGTWCVDPAAIEKKITPRTKAIIAVHLYGHPADMAPIMELATRKKIFVIEDAAEAHGAEYHGKRAGSLGHAACFSFYANKIITTGEGGMVVTDDAAFAARCRKLRDQANEPERRFWHREIGFNYRMTNMQAGVGLAQMKRIDEFVETRRRNAKLYNDLLRGLKDVTLPPEQPWARNVFWMYSLLVNPGAAVGRDELMNRLKAANIDSRPFFHAIHRQPAYEKNYAGDRHPVAEDLSARGINLPSGNELTEAQVRRVAAAVIQALSR